MTHQNDYLLGSYMDPEDEFENEAPESFEDDIPGDDMDNGIHIDPKL